MFKRTCLSILIIIILSVVSYSNARAQDEQNSPYYIVQEGDSLWQIAARFGVAVEDLMKENNISDASQLNVGARLTIPGLQGVDGQLTTITVAYGDTFRSLSRYYDLSGEALARLNHMVSPSELYSGYSLIVPIKENQIPISVARINLAKGSSLMELAILHGKNVWALTLENKLAGTWSGLPGDVVQVVDDSSELISPAGLPEIVTRVEVNPVSMRQGDTAVIKVSAPSGISMSGSLGERVLYFFPQGNDYVSLQGIHALTTPGLYPLALQGKLPNGDSFAFTQNILVLSADFAYDPSLTVDPITIDPAVTGPENELWASLGANATPEKLWSGIFSSPVPLEFTNCWPSLFGNRRSYNGSSYDFFHGGLDFCGTVGTELYASATGKVVYTGLLTVRGNVVVIDHGWGVYTAYDHLSKILAQDNEMVQPGQLIGLGGATGRTTGPHLHWEVWAGGVQVNPVDWLEKSYP
jgi:murein DD-endopeptidase MepM/ murein hydrolase activator NlpD